MREKNSSAAVEKEGNSTAWLRSIWRRAKGQKSTSVRRMPGGAAAAPAPCPMLAEADFPSAAAADDPSASPPPWDRGVETGSSLWTRYPFTSPDLALSKRASASARARERAARPASTVARSRAPGAASVGSASAASTATARSVGGCALSALPASAALPACTTRWGTRAASERALLLGGRPHSRRQCSTISLPTPSWALRSWRRDMPLSACASLPASHAGVASEPRTRSRKSWRGYTSLTWRRTSLSCFPLRRSVRML
mmetsp:Transcript_27335/g.73629  ORF Transcript_27335/g.73629 Transcript_27335/m.73629 type:complete len:257 (+) Transcript_27335:446-1216(+)